MRLSRVPALLAAVALLGAGVGCATTVEGTGSPAVGLVTPGPSGTGPSTPGPTDTPGPTATTPAPTPTTNPVVIKRKLLCVLERASITSTNSQFNKSKDRAVQLRVLRTGVSTISGHLSRSNLPATDGIRRSGQAVLDQLNRLVREAASGGSPSTSPYNAATKRFQQACSALS